MSLTVRFKLADGFMATWTDYGLNDAALDLLKHNLERNPILGKAARDEGGVRRYSFRRYIVSYRPAFGDSGIDGILIWLLDVTPEDAPPSTMGRWTNKALKGAAQAWRFWRGNFSGSEDE